MFVKEFAYTIVALIVFTSVVSALNVNIINHSNPVKGGNWLYVGGSGPGNYSSIQNAIDEANDGDTVFVYNGTYNECIVLNKSINLIGENSHNTTINSKDVLKNDPVNSNPSPKNREIDVEIPPSNFSIYVSDADGGTMNVTFWTNESGNWTICQTNESVTNGTCYLMNKSWVNTLGTTYWWRVNTSDGENCFDNDTYSFTTTSGPKFRLWALADTHVKLYQYSAFKDAIIDSNSAFIWNISIVLGDLIQNACNDYTYVEYYRWQKVRNYSFHGVQDFYPIYGNHELYHNGSGWGNWTKQIDPVGDHGVGNNTNENRTYDMINRLDESHPLSNSNDSRYYFAVGNLLFVTFGPFPTVANHTLWFEWFKYVVKNNDHMNIIVYTHFPLPNSSLYQGAGYKWEDASTYENWLNSTPTTINLWLSGHTHSPGEVIYNSTTTYNYWNITFIDSGNIIDSRISTMLNFTDGFSSVVLGRYNHYINKWIFNTTVNLTYPFDIDYVYSPQQNRTRIQELNENLKNTSSWTGLRGDQFGILIGRDTQMISNSLISGFTIVGDDSYNSIGIGSHLNSNNITIENCIIHNFGNGILFSDGCKDIVIRNCKIYNNSELAGILFGSDDVKYFEISGCNIYSNNYGINVVEAKNGLIYHNNLFDNDINAYDSGNNSWDNGKYGNYWDDYIENYPNARKLLWKRIWDTPYNVSGGDNQDNFPLIKPFIRYRNQIVNISLNNLLQFKLQLYQMVQKILYKLSL